MTMHQNPDDIVECEVWELKCPKCGTQEGDFDFASYYDSDMDDQMVRFKCPACKHIGTEEEFCVSKSTVTIEQVEALFQKFFNTEH
jgi:predicted RNA-binding Zn-ribbon protein involved in translation (DUF1610 family)